MKLADFYTRAIAAAIDHDPRGRETVLGELDRRRKDYESLSAREKELFDLEGLSNPYADSRILHGDGSLEVRNLLVGIDVDTAEMLLADRLRSRDVPVDLVVSHHPGGAALANLYDVISMQADILQRFGIPINIAEGLLEDRSREIERRLMPLNHYRAVDAARLLSVPFMCLHTAADNMVTTYLQGLLDDRKPHTVDDVIELLRDIPEYRDASRSNGGPTILLGSKKRKAGKIFVDMTGGTEGSKDIFQTLSLSGVNTIVGMHLSEDHRKEAEKNHLNVIIAGHIASDTIGMNLLLDEVMRDEPLQVTGCSGFRRVSRLKA